MALRRLAVLRSHLAPEPPPQPQPPAVSILPCRASSQLHKEQRGDPSCIFCRIINGDSPAFKLFEDDVCICILDSNPLTVGHSLVIPKRHFPSLEETSSSVVGAICSKLPFLSNAIMKATQCDSFNLVVNNGAAAGQVIYHTHFHIIPRKFGDKLWPSESVRRRRLEMNEETISLVSCIKESLVSSSTDSFNTFKSLEPKEL